MLFFDDGGERAVIEPDPADVGELGPLHDGSTAVSAAIADMVENAVGAATSGMTSVGSSLWLMRARGTGPALTTGTGPWKAGRGSEGRVCLGWPRGGRGPLCRRRGVGGERRGMVVML